MLNKKAMILAILLISLFAISTVGAADNTTRDVVSVDEDNTIAIENSFHDEISYDDSNSVDNNIIGSSVQDNDVLGGLYSNDDVEIPMKLSRDGNRISFAFDRTFYVNRRTLEVSDVYQSGWVMTPHFYLPVNGRKKLNGKTMYFELNELGYDKISTIIPLRYELDRTIIGVCTDGDFCVVGGDH